MTHILPQLAPILIYTSQNQAIQAALSTQEHPLHIAQTIDDILQQIIEAQAALVILDDNEDCSILSEQITAPILLISDDVDAALSAGASDCVSMHPQLLAKRVDYLLHADNYAAYEQLPAMIHSINPDGKLRYVNPHWLSVMGYEREEVIGKSILDFMTETSRRVAPRMIKSFWESGVLRNLAFRYIKKNGETIDALVDSNRLSNNRNLTVLREINELKHAEDSLRDSRNELQSIMRALPDTVMVLNRQGDYVYIASEGQYQPTPDSFDLIGKNLKNTLPQDIAQILQNLIDKTLSKNKVQHTQYELTEDNESYFYHASASPVNDNEVVIVVRDTSEQKRAEDNLKESENNYRRLFENATDGIFVVDVTTGGILQANPQASLMLGYSRAELMSMKIDQLESDQISIHDESMVGINSTNKLTLETQYIRRDGSLVDVEISSRALLQAGKLILISFVRDISDRNQALEEMERQRNLAEGLLDTVNALNEASDLNAVLDKILVNVSRIIQLESANIMIIEDDAAHIIRHLGYEAGGFQAEDISNIVLSLEEADNLRWIVENKKALRIDDTHNSQQFTWVDITTSQFVRSLLTIPIITNDEVVGFINLDSSKVSNFTQEQEYQLTAFANQAAIAMQQASLVEKLHDYTGKLEKRVSERTQELLSSNADLKQAQNQLADERNLLRLIIDTIPDAIYVKDTESHFLIANQATVNNIEGISTEAELIGKNDVEFYPEIAERLQDEETEIIKTGKARFNRSEMYHNQDGSVAHLLITKMPLLDANGEVKGIIGVNHDITQLRQAETRLEQVVKSARCLLWSATVTQDESESNDFIWDYKIVNEEAAQGFLKLQATEKTYSEAWLATIPPSEQIRRDSIFEDCIQSSKHDYHLEYVITPNADKTLWLSEDVIIEKIDDNRWKLVGVCTDITSQKEAEQQLQNLNEELEQRVDLRTLELTKINEELTAQITEREKAEAAERQQRIIAEAIRDSVAKLSSSLDRDAIFDFLLDAIGTIVPNDASNIMLVEDEEVVIVRATRYEDDIIGRRYIITDLPTLTHVMKERHAWIISDVKNYEQWYDPETNNWISSYMGVPIKLNNEVIGFINIDSSKPNNFTEEQANWMMTFGDQAGIAIRNARYTADLEERIEARTHDLEFERAQLKAILDGVTDGVMYTDIERRPQYINRALVEISGFSQAEWINGTAQAHMNVAPQDHLDDVWNRILRWLENNPVWTGETEFKRKDSSIFEAGLARTTVKNQQGVVLGIVTVLRDISDERHLQKQKARFITTAAHELRTPIANLKTRLFLMKRSPEKFTDHIAVAESVVNLMQNLVEHMFDLSRFERGIIEIRREAVHIQNFIKEVLQYQAPQAERLDIALKLDAPIEPILIEIDPYRLTQVFLNLIGNALKYTPAHSDILINIDADDKHVRIDIQDSGEGIPAEHIPNLFQPFYQVSNNENGAGLGLAIVYEIIKAHNGQITVDSQLHKGTTFHIRLPISETELESI